MSNSSATATCLGQPPAHPRCSTECPQPMTIPVVTKISKGTRYVGTVTGTVNGEHVYRDIEFTASRDQDLEPFVRDRDTTPDQDRVFVESRFGSSPSLFVAGSIRKVAA